MEELFSDSLVYADSTVGDVAEKVKALSSSSAQREEYRRRIMKKHDELTRMHETEVASLRRLLNG